MNGGAQLQAAPNPSTGIAWQNLIQYYLSCLKQEDGFTDLLPRSNTGSRYALIKGGPEQLLSRPEGGLQVDHELRALIEKARVSGDSLFYGYPAFVHIEEVNGKTQRSLGALLVMELAWIPAPGDPIPTHLLPKSDEPFFHPRVFANLGLKDEQREALTKTLPPGQAMGSPESLAGYLKDLCDALNLRGGNKLDPVHLDTAAEGTIDGNGLHNQAIVFRAEGSVYTRLLLKELDQLRSKEAQVAQTAARFLLESSSSVANTTATSPIVELLPIASNDAQRAALQSALTAPLTVVTGPPGTGKSQLITNVIASAWGSNQSVLVVSTNNKAVDVACQRAQDIHPGLVIRTGSKVYREEAKATLERLLIPGGAHPDSTSLALAHKSLTADLKSLREHLETRSWAESRLCEVLLGQAPLVAAAGWPTATMRQGIEKSGTARNLLAKIRRLRKAWFFRKWRISRFGRLLQVDIESKGELIEQFLSLEVEAETLRQRIRGSPAVDVLVRGIVEAAHKLQAVSVDISRSLVDKAAATGAREISTMINARVAPNYSGIAGAFTAVLTRLRAWASTALSAGATIPLAPGLFDLLIVDEASQCAIPQIVPLLFRAKRALILGDAQQLAPIASMARADEQRLMVEAGLDTESMSRRDLVYSQRSVFDVMAKRCERVQLLDEHYRSHPQIIELSNRLFYEGRLTVLTDPKGLVDFGKNAVAWRNVVGMATRPDAGSAINNDEAAAVAEEVVRLMSRQEALTIGVVTPFSAQASRIHYLLGKATTSEQRERARLTVGTAHRLQGDERDVIVFSPVASDGIPSQTLRWLTDTPNLFNVAITRAKSYLLVVGNRSYCRSMSGVMGELAKYVDEIEVARAVSQAGNAGNLHSPAEGRLYEALLKTGVEIRPKVLVKGYECDFVVGSGETAINIECDGVHHIGVNGRLRLQDRARDALIQYQGWKVVRIPAWKCLSDAEGAVREIFAELGIQRTTGL